MPNDDLSIDREHLDYELLRQATLFQLWAEKLARADTERLFAKERFEQKKAELYSRIRRAPLDYDITRVTDAAIQAQVMLEEEYRQAFGEMIQAREEHAIINTYVDALNYKKSAIENAVRLLLAGYFTIPHVAQEYRERVSTDTTERITGALNASSRLLNRRD